MLVVVLAKVNLRGVDSCRIHHFKYKTLRFECITPRFQCKVLVFTVGQSNFPVDRARALAVAIEVVDAKTSVAVLQNTSFLNTQFLVFNAQFLVFNTKILVFNAQFLVFNTKVLVFNKQFITFTHKPAPST